MNTKEPKSVRILLIEDDDHVRRTLRRQLEAEGFEVVGAADGSEGLQRMKDGDFAAIVSDHHMPGMDGVDVLEIARSFKPSAARVLSTGSDELAIVARAVNDAGVHAIVPKPWPQEGIGDLVRGALRRHADSQAARPSDHRDLSPEISIESAYLATDEIAAARRPRPPPLPPAAKPTPVAQPAPVASAPVVTAAVAAVVAPIAPQVAQPIAQPIAPQAAAETAPVILSVDDDPRWARCVDRVLRDEGYGVHTATSPSMALRAMQGAQYAMLLLDVNMPKESGIDLARRVRRGEGGAQHREVPIVFLTSDMTGESFEGSFEVGALRYVRKSSDANELIGVVQEVMHGGN